MKVGIDSISFSIPKIYLPIKTLAENRNIEPEKLINGLGLHRMSFPDVYQDVVTFASNAVLKLIQQENLDPAEISRIYVGTESSVDSSKPVASYIITNLEQIFGNNTFQNCDATDMTFACIGAVDAMHNCLDFIRLNPNKKAIVVATDTAKYDLASTGEYTQGAGSIAMLLTANPRLMSFSQHIGISTEGVFDFFKPRRTVSKAIVFDNNLNPEWNGVLENVIEIYKDQPVFDGQYSNNCYINRITAAYFHFKKESNQTEVIYNQWVNILMHLPYAFQGRRTFAEIFSQENPKINLNPNDADYKNQLKLVAKNPEYLTLINTKIYPSEIASGQVGNIYTGSIFLGLLSTFCHHLKEKNEIIGNKMGFIAYGSGSKSKVFEATVSENWQEIIKKNNLFETLANCTEIDFDTYSKLHKKEQLNPVLPPNEEFVLDYIEAENPVLIGARNYKYQKISR